MEQVSDGEDFVPPTPINKREKRNLMFVKPNSKVNKTHKRKKTSGVSPEFKKFKDKSKQATLLNYILKTGTLEDKSDFKEKSVLANTVKVNLNSKFDFLNASSSSNDKTAVHSNHKTECFDCAVICHETEHASTEYIKANLNKETESSSIYLKNGKLESLNKTSDINTNSDLSNSLKSKLIAKSPFKMCESELLVTDSIKLNSNITPGLLGSISKINLNFELPNDMHKNNSSRFNATKTINDSSNHTDAVSKTALNHKLPNKIPKNNSSMFNDLDTVNDSPSHSLINKSIYQINNESCNVNDHKINKKSVTCDMKICTDVENLKINGRNYNAQNLSSASQINCEKKTTQEAAVICMSDTSTILNNEDSLTWLTDLDWKNDSFNECKLDVVKSQSHQNKSNIKDFQQSSILFRVQEVSKNSSANEVKLILKEANSDICELKTCYLRGFWVDSLVHVGDIVHVINQFENNVTVIDNQSGFIVINPDFLLSSTAIVSTLFCMRKAALNHILPSWASGNKLMMIGNLVHDIFQQSVNTHASTIEEITKILKAVMRKQENLIALSCQSTPCSEIEAKLMDYVPNIFHWIKRHVALKGMTATENIQVTCVEGIEDNVWCPKYGIKGKIDMTVKTLLRDQGISKLLPLELKTGRPTFSAEHTGQVNLYTLMMDERTKGVSEGLLLYLKDAANMKTVTANHNSRRGLIQLRNELAFYTYKWFSSPQNEDIEHCHLPAPINSKKMCEKCPYVLPCTVYQKSFAESKKLNEDHAMVSLIASTTNHLTSNHLEYFIHWSNLLLLESTSSTVSNAFWTETSISREKKGMCLSWMLLDKCLPKNDMEEKFYSHLFVRSPQSPVDEDILSVGLRKGEYIAISNQDNMDEVAIAMGYIFDICDKFVKVGIDRNLCLVPHYKNHIFRIDKQVSNSAAACIRNNLMTLMANENQSERMRRFVIEKQNPNFLNSLSKNVALLGRPILKSLNKIQQKAILRALMAEDYFLIKGMPGTGKTSTIVALVRLLVKMGVSVLLTSYTHSAIDNILLKLKEHMTFVRIGQEARIHDGLKEFSFEYLTKDFTSSEQFKLFIEQQMVVATTCLGINHAMFSIKKFDICIVDEASQINQIACLGPLFLSKKFILVGDDKQLPPLVINDKAKLKGMEESLFQRLENPSNCIELVIQYRMNREIMRICNELTYGGILQCGSEGVAQAVLQLNESNSSRLQTQLWIKSVLNCSLLQSVLFINTKEISGCQFEESPEINDIEANITKFILQCLLEHKISACNIGIISFYRRQVDLIRKKILMFDRTEIEVNTVDQYQGRDKDIIIISCVKCGDPSVDSKKKGSILNDERRLNVAITRAKKKLLIIGCKSSLMCYKPFQNLITCLKSEQILNIAVNDFSLKD